MPQFTPEKSEFGNPQGSTTHEATYLLGHAVGVAVVNKLHNDELYEENRKLEYESRHDSLTDLLNRRGLEDYVEKNELEHCIIVYIDVTNFKAVNDLYNHESGDKLLVEIARMLEGIIRPYDAVARTGGDEFLLIMKPPTTVEGELIPPGEQLDTVTCLITTRIEATLANNQKLVDVCGFNIAFGGVTRQPGETVEEMIQKADEKMKKRKAGQHDENGAHRPRQSKDQG